MSIPIGHVLLAAIGVFGSPVSAETPNLGLGETAPNAPRGWVMAAEFGGALVGTAPFGACVVLSSLFSYSVGTGPPGAGMFFAIVYTAAGALVTPFSTAGGTLAVGAATHQGGRWWPTVGGAAVGHGGCATPGSRQHPGAPRQCGTAGCQVHVRRAEHAGRLRRRGHRIQQKPSKPRRFEFSRQPAGDTATGCAAGEAAGQVGCDRV